MSKIMTKDDLHDKMIRPKRLYLTSEDVQDFDDAGSCRFTLREPIVADEGFRLVYGLQSFGYTATANSISTRQQNNTLHLILTYLEPSYVYNSTTGFSVNAIAGQEKKVHMELVIPDGYYSTLTELFQVLNDSSVNYIPSGIKRDVTLNNIRSETSCREPNETAIRLTWTETNYGYMVDAKLETGVEDLDIRNDYIQGNTHLQAYQVNKFLKSLEFLPYDQKSTKLYYLLFQNNNDLADKPANVPTNLPYTGPNPPPSVYLAMAAPLSYVANTSNPVDFINPNVGFTYQWSFGGASDLLREFQQETFPIEPQTPGVYFSCQTIGYSNLPLQIWYVPRLYPIYVEIDTSLETQNLTVDGYSSNLLFRHFPLGADQNAKSFFQSWDQPVFHHMRSSRHQIDSIKIDFVSESNIWEFFNMTFFLEILFFETPDEEELPSFADVPFQIPTEDAMTSSLQQYSNHYNNPFPINVRENQTGILRVGSSRSGQLKRRR